MKNSLLLCLAFAAVAAFGCSNSRDEVKAGKPSQQQESSLSPTQSIEGNWVRVWESEGGRIRADSGTQMKMFLDGHFTFIGYYQDGAWLAGGGTYSLDENHLYREVVQYCTRPEFIGTVDEQYLELRGDTLYSSGFTKVIKADGRNVTDSFPHFDEKRVRIH